MTAPHEEQTTVTENPGEVVTSDGRVLAECRFGTVEGRAARARFFAAAPDMARALLSVRARVEEAGKAMPRQRTAEEMSVGDFDVTMPASVVRECFAALKKAGML